MENRSLYKKMKNNKIVVGVVGIGRIGKLHVDNILKLGNVRVKTIADTYIEESREWAENRGITHLVKDAQLIMKDEEIDVVFICSSTDSHVDLIKSAAKAKKNIFCEKPISFSDEATLNAYKLVKENDIKIQIGFNRRFDKNYARVNSLVKNRTIGDLHILRITSRDPEPPSLDYVKHSGGIFMDMSIHDFDMARFVSGLEVDEVFVVGSALVNPKIAEVGDIDTAVITLKFENGTVGVIDNSREAVYGYDQRIEVFGSKGSAESFNERQTRVKVSTVNGVHEDQPLHFFLERYEEAYLNEIIAFFEAISHKTPIACTFEDGIMAQYIAQAAKKSFETGLPVKVQKIKES